MPAAPAGDAERRRVLAACRTAGIDPGQAELLSLGDSGTFRLGSKLVAKVTRSPAQQATAHREVAISRWLSSVGLPAVVAANDAIDLGPYSVTFWEYLTDLRAASPAEIGRFLARLHDLQPPVGPRLREVQPFVSIADRIAAAPVRDDEKQFLQHRLDELTAQWPTTAFERPDAVIHGDPHGGNVVATPGGTILILDLERFSLGPPEWDLTLMASEYDSFRWITAEQYRSFVDAYGYDVLSSPVYPWLRNVRELRMTSWLANKADQSQAIRDEVGHRIACLRGDQGPRPWIWSAS
jgi:hypothetical protein